MSDMSDMTKNKRRFLKALIEYAEKSGTFNPYFHMKELMDSLGISEKEFNIIQKQLGDRYCLLVDIHDNDKRYRINVSECLSLQEQYDQELIQEKRHKQLLRLAILVAILGAVLGVALNMWLS